MRQMSALMWLVPFVLLGVLPIAETGQRLEIGAQVMLLTI